MSKKTTEQSVANLENDLAHAGNPLGASEVAMGVMSGAVIGAVGGIPGVVVGAVVGGAAGVAAAVASSRAHAKTDAEDAELDETIGVSGGEMGAPNLKHPPAERGTYSASSTGTGGGDTSVPAEGPAQPPESED